MSSGAAFEQASSDTASLLREVQTEEPHHSTVDPPVDRLVVLPEASGLGTAEGLLGASRFQRAAKRFIDIVVSLVALALLSGIFVAVALAIRFTSRGPILYPHQRAGRNGERFTMYKFRSMYDRAHEDRAYHLRRNEATGPVFKIRNDPRVTRVGRFLRRTSIDELPQLFNVLLGEMSLVGPRPALPEECHHYGEREKLRLLVKPGLTCIWQVSGRSDISFDTWIEMDIEYIRSWSTWGDIALLCRTIPAVLSARGAY